MSSTFNLPMPRAARSQGLHCVAAWLIPNAAATKGVLPHDRVLEAHREPRGDGGGTQGLLARN